jgi:biopolymer transport protein ExbD
MLKLIMLATAASLLSAAALAEVPVAATTMPASAPATEQASTITAQDRAMLQQDALKSERLQEQIDQKAGH